MVRMKIHVYEPVVVARHALDSKQVLTERDVQLEKMDVTKIGHYYFTEPKVVIGMVLKRVVNAGTPINSMMIDKPIIMKRMSMIRIISRFGGIEVETDGQALQDGREGDLIRIKNMRSNKILSGKVVDQVTVDVSTR